jgi:hypothetical protein
MFSFDCRDRPKEGKLAAAPREDAADAERDVAAPSAGEARRNDEQDEKRED